MSTTATAPSKSRTTRPGRTTCKTRVKAPASWFTLGDTVWWQGSMVMWTPYDKSVVDHQLERGGYSYSDPYPGDGTLVLGTPEAV